MLEALIKDAKNIIGRLEDMGFTNAAEILETAVDGPDLRSPAYPKYKSFHLKDPAEDPDGITFSFLVNRYKSFEPFELTKVSASMQRTQKGGKEPELIRIDFELLEEFPSKRELTKEIVKEYYLAGIKEELRADRLLKEHLLVLGFKDYNGLVNDASYLFGPVALYASVDVNNKIGSGTEKVNFSIHLKKIEKGEGFKIESITAALHTPIRMGKQEEPLAPLSAFHPKNGKLPTVDKMVGSLIKEAQSKLQRYANAFKISKDNKKIVQKIYGGQRPLGK